MKTETWILLGVIGLVAYLFLKGKGAPAPAAPAATQVVFKTAGYDSAPGWGQSNQRGGTNVWDFAGQALEAAPKIFGSIGDWFDEGSSYGDSHTT